MKWTLCSTCKKNRTPSPERLECDECNEKTFAPLVEHAKKLALKAKTKTDFDIPNVLQPFGVMDPIEAHDMYPDILPAVKCESCGRAKGGTCGACHCPKNPKAVALLLAELEAHPEKYAYREEFTPTEPPFRITTMPPPGPVPPVEELVEKGYLEKERYQFLKKPVPRKEMSFINQDALRHEIMREDAIIMGRAPDLLPNDIDEPLKFVCKEPQDTIKSELEWRKEGDHYIVRKNDCLCPKEIGPHPKHELTIGAVRVAPSVWKEKF